MLPGTLETYTAAYFIGDKLLGTSTYRARPHSQHSHLYVCRTCGEIWGRIIVTPDPDYDVHVSPCEKHTGHSVQDCSAFPGSFLPTILDIGGTADMSIMKWAYALPHLPRAVLLREFNLALEAYDRKHSTSPGGC